MTDENNNKIVTKLNISFERKSKLYTKNIFIIMNDDLEKNIKDPNNNQYFCDTTYYTIPPHNKGSKIWILLSFNIKLMKTLLCCIAIIRNENKETIIRIFDHLSIKYNFNPILITMDFGRGPHTAVKEKYPNCRVFPCFRMMQKIYLHLGELKSNNKSLKNKAKDLVANIKLLCFINKEEINSFYNKIKNKYNDDFESFLIYFYNGLFSDRSWNYYNYINLILMMYFFWE